jgi:hypothetical protein
MFAAASTGDIEDKQIGIMKVWLSPVTQELTRVEQQAVYVNVPIEEEVKGMEVRQIEEVGPYPPMNMQLNESVAL